MLEGKASIKETDMPEKMHMQAMACASQVLDNLHDVFDCISIAAHIKKVRIYTLPIFFLYKKISTFKTFYNDFRLIFLKFL